jgi:hypothetical protein
MGFCSVARGYQRIALEAKKGDNEHRDAATYLAVSHDIQQRDDVGAAGKVLKNLDLALDLLLLNRLEDLDDTFLVVDHIDALKDLRVFAPACRQTQSARLFFSPRDNHPDARVSVLGRAGAGRPWRIGQRGGVLKAKGRGDVPILRTTS